MTGMLLNSVQQNLIYDQQQTPAGAMEPLVLLHGLFGDAGNWASRTGVYARHTGTIAMDLRNHGSNEHVERMDYPSMADDVLTTLDKLGISQCHLLGHSMGGKVAMHIATHHPERVTKLIIVDIAPRSYPPHHRNLINAMLSVPLENMTKRSEAESILATVEPDVSVRRFLMKSLVRHKGSDSETIRQSNTEQANEPVHSVGQYRWEFNLGAIADSYPALALSLIHI